jgi:hypothetical protein
MHEEFEAARITNLMGTGHSVQAAQELSVQMQCLQRQGPFGMQAAQELLVDTKQDFYQAGFGQNIQDVPVVGAFGQRVGSSVYMMTDAGAQPIAQLMYQGNFQEGGDPLGYGIQGMRVGGFGGRFGGDINLQFGNFDLNLFSGGMRQGFPVGGQGYYAPQPGWQAGFQTYLGHQNLNYGQVQQSFNSYPVGSTTIINNNTTINNRPVSNDTSSPVSITNANNIINHRTVETPATPATSTVAPWKQRATTAATAQPLEPTATTGTPTTSPWKQRATAPQPVESGTGTVVTPNRQYAPQTTLQPRAQTATVPSTAEVAPNPQAAQAQQEALRQAHQKQLLQQQELEQQQKALAAAAAKRTAPVPQTQPVATTTPRAQPPAHAPAEHKDWKKPQ